MNTIRCFCGISAILTLQISWLTVLFAWQWCNTDIILHKHCSVEAAVPGQHRRSTDGDRRWVSTEAGNVDGRSQLQPLHTIPPRRRTRSSHAWNIQHHPTSVVCRMVLLEHWHTGGYYLYLSV